MTQINEEVNTKKKFKNEEKYPCKYRIYERSGQGGLISKDYTCHEVRELKESLKDKFRETNQTDAVIQAGGRDISYERFCEKLDNYVNNCSCR